MPVNLSPAAGAAAQFFTDNGVPLAGGLIYTYAAGTTTPQAAYTSSTGGTAWSNPIVLNSAGRVSGGGEIWLTGNLAYKFVLYDANSVLIATYDQIRGVGDTTALLAFEALLAGSTGSSLVGFLQAGTGAIATTVQAKLRERVSVYDFMTPAQVAAAKANDTTLDVTSAFTLAIGTGNRLVWIPVGSYKITDLRYQVNTILQGEAIGATFLLQGDITKHCIYVLSVGSVSQLYGCGLLDVTVLGVNNAAAVSAVCLQAVAPYTVQFGTWRFNAGGDNSSLRASGTGNPPTAVSTALELIMGVNNEIYSNTFRVMCWASTGTAFKTGGVYNEYWLESVQSANAVGILDASINSNFHYLVTDGAQQLGGQNNVFLNPTVESIWGTYSGGAANLFCIDVQGYKHTLIDPTVQAVTNAMANYGIRVQNSHTLLNPNMYGSTPTYPLWLTSGSSGLLSGAVMNASCEAITTQATLANWTLAGDCSTAFPTYYQDKYIGTALVNQLLTRAAAPTLAITANVITPAKLISFVGAGLIKTITVPALAAASGASIILIPTAAFTTDATGNIAIASTAVIGKQMTMIYDSGTSKWYPSY